METCIFSFQRPSQKSSNKSVSVHHSRFFLIFYFYDLKGKHQLCRCEQFRPQSFLSYLKKGGNKVVFGWHMTEESDNEAAEKEL